MATLITENNGYELYNQSLDDCNERYMGFYPSDILKSCDPIAYELGFQDFCEWLAEDGIYVENYTEDYMPEEEDEED